MPTPRDFADMTEAYKRLSPHPEHFDDFVAMLSGVASQLEGWTDEQLAGVAAPARPGRPDARGLPRLTGAAVARLDALPADREPALRR
jgi:hypothetical protein